MSALPVDYIALSAHQKPSGWKSDSPFCRLNFSRLFRLSAVLCVAKVGLKDRIINGLYYGNICPVEQMGRLTPEAKAILKRLHENEDKLEESLDEQEKAILHSIQYDRLELAASVGEKRFREAFTLGERLAIEIFTTELGNQYSDNME